MRETLNEETIPQASEHTGLGSPMVIAIAVALGGALALQAQLNGALTARTGSAVLVTLVSFAVGTTILVPMVIIRREVPSRTQLRRWQWRRWWLSNGPLGAFLIVAISAGVPLLGVALTTVLTVAGQTIMGIALDTRGTGVDGRIRVSGRRATAVGVALLGLAVTVLALPISPHRNAAAMVIMILLLVVAGVAAALQQAANGAITGVSRRPVLAAVTNYIGGLMLLVVIAALQWAAGTLKVTDWPTAAGDWWLYAGGLFGTLFVVTAAWAVRRIGVLTLSLAVVAGQTVAAVFLDLFTGAAKVTILTVIPIVAVLTAVVLAVEQPRPGVGDA